MNKNNSTLARNDIGFWILATLATFFTIALASHTATDHFRFEAHDTSTVINTTGFLGGFIANALIDAMGYSAWLIPVLMAQMAVMQLIDNQKNIKKQTLISICMIIVIMPLLALYIPNNFTIIPNYILNNGGTLGTQMAIMCTTYLGTIGTTVMLSGTLILLCQMQLNISFIQIMKQLAKYVVHSTTVLFKCLASYFKEQVNKQRVFKKEYVKTPIHQRDIAQHKLKMPIQSQKTTNDEQLPLKINNKDIRPEGQSLTKGSIKQKPINVDEATKLLKISNKTDLVNHEEQLTLSKNVEKILLDFGFEVNVTAHYPGPVVTRFELSLRAGTKANKITAIAKDIARSLSVTSVRVVEVIPGKSVIGIEIPNENREIVYLKELFESKTYKETKATLPMTLGKDISGDSITVDLAKMPHLLVAGTTGSGKSVGINVMILSLLLKRTPEQLKLILIDPKMLELAVYADIPHLLTPVVTDMNDAATALRWSVAEMERRYKLMAEVGVRNIANYNDKISQHNQHLEEGEEAKDILPHIVIVADEFADMFMVVGKKIEQLIARLAQKARAAGIHLILATQRPSVDVVTGLIKANIPSRISFHVSSKIDSRTVLDQQGAEQLLGHGDMLYLPSGSSAPTRVHGAYVSDDEVHSIVKMVKKQGGANYCDDVINSNNDVPGIDSDGGNSSDQRDALFDQAVDIVAKSRKASISYLQRRLRIGYNRAASLIEAMEEEGIVGAPEQNGAREVLAAEPREG